VTTFDFRFILHLMKSILGISQDSQKGAKYLHIECLKETRETRWYLVVSEVSSICGKNEIDIPKMYAVFVS